MTNDILQAIFPPLMSDKRIRYLTMPNGDDIQIDARYMDILERVEASMETGSLVL